MLQQKRAQRQTSTQHETAAAQNSSFGHVNGCGLLQTMTSASAASKISPPKRYQPGTTDFRLDAASGGLTGAA